MKFNYINKKLIALRSEVELQNEQGHYDINKIVEDVYMHILNDVYGWSLKNANLIEENFPAIDLVDDENEIVIQVTSSIHTGKLKGTIEKFKKLEEPYAHYKLKMFYIKSKPKFQKSSLEIFAEEGVKEEDFLGIKDILDEVKANVDMCERLYETLNKIFDDKESESTVIINIAGDVKGVVNAEDGSVVNQTIS